MSEHVKDDVGHENPVDPLGQLGLRQPHGEEYGDYWKRKKSHGHRVSGICAQRG